MALSIKNKRERSLGTLRKEGAPMIYIWLLFGLWCHNPMLAKLMDYTYVHCLSFCYFQNI